MTRMSLVATPIILQARGSGCPAEGRSVRADLTRAREMYQNRRDILAEELRRVLPPDVHWTLPAAGLNLWLTLPEHRHD